MPAVDVGFLTNALQGVNLAAPTWDLFILLFFVVGSLVYGLSMGRERVVMLIVAIYMDLAVVSTAPYLKTAFRGDVGEAFALQIAVFVGVFLVLLFLLSKTALAHTFSLGDSGHWWQVLTFSFLHIGLLTSVILSYLPEDALRNLSMVTRQIFVSETGKFVWVLLPILAMIVIRGERKNERV